MVFSRTRLQRNPFRGAERDGILEAGSKLAPIQLLRELTTAVQAPGRNKTATRHSRELKTHFLGLTDTMGKLELNSMFPPMVAHSEGPPDGQEDAHTSPSQLNKDTLQEDALSLKSLGLARPRPFGHLCSADTKVATWRAGDSRATHTDVRALRTAMG